jgi:hypothetical protein
MQEYVVKLDKVMTEKQLHSKSGFTSRKHFPDFIFTDGNKDSVNCVELELTAKARAKFEKNIEENYMTYETQYWVVPKAGVKIKQILKEQEEKYHNIKIIELEGVQEYVRENK